MLDAICPLEYRYLDIPEAPKLRQFLSEEAFIRYLCKVETALVYKFAKYGLCSKDVADAVAKAAPYISASDVYQEEKRIHHQMRALVNCLAKKAGKDAAPWIHLGATSHDIICTADSLRYKDFVAQSLLPCLIDMEKRLIEIALREKNTPQIGRTHGQHAVPITFGFAMAEYVSRLGGRIIKIFASAENLRGKFSGAVGAYNGPSLLFSNPIEFEKEFLAELGLTPADHSTQIVEPEYLLDLIHAVTSCFGVLANLADDIRHLQRSEIGEVAEQFDATQVGSSTMPHKQNPISFENAKSLYKTFMPRIITYYLDQISEHQRDLTNSASSRFVGETFCGLYLAADRMESALGKLGVRHDSLKRNLNQNKNTVMAEPCYMILARHGHPNAHEEIRQAVQSGKQELSALVEQFPGVVLNEHEKNVLAGPENYLGFAREKTELVCSEWLEKIKGLESMKKIQ